MPTIKFEVKSNASMYSVKIDDEPLRLIDGQGSMRLSSGRHELQWFMTGASGAAFALVGKDGETEVVAVKNRRIPPLEGKTGDYLDFDV